jgi:hypothetical protein
MKKRTYGTGNCHQRDNGKWRLIYRPKWALKPLSKTVDAGGKKDAENQLRDWVKELDKQAGPTVKVSILQLIELHVADMRTNGCDLADTEIVERRAKKHLAPAFADFDFAVYPLKAARIKQYCNARLQAGAKRATINRELSALRRALALAVEDELIGLAVPKIPKLKENNVRIGLVSAEMYGAIMQGLPDDLKPVWCYGFRLGVRKGELLKLETEWLLPYWKTEEPYIKIPGFARSGKRITKSGKPHVIPLYHSELRAFTEMLLSDPTRDPKCPYLFQHEGRAIKSSYLRAGFEAARLAAKYPEAIFHDTRRTAVARMEDAGIPRKKAMEITGHLTESVYLRYNIGVEDDVIDAGRQLREHENKRLERNSFQDSFPGPTDSRLTDDSKPAAKRLN